MEIINKLALSCRRARYELRKGVSFARRIRFVRYLPQNIVITRVKEHRLFIVAALLGAMLVYFATTTIVSELTYYEYSYKGEVLGVVKSEGAVLDRVSSIEKKIGEEADVVVDINTDKNIELKPVFRLAVALDNTKEVDSAPVAEEKLVEASSKHLDLYQLIISGKAIGLFESKEACDDIVASAKAILLGQPEDKFISVEIVEAIEVTSITTEISQLSDKDEAIRLLTDTSKGVFTLHTKQHLTFKEAVPYQIEYRDTNDLYQGEEQTLVEGVNGEAEITADLTKVGGVEIDRKEYTNNRLKEPINAVIKRGIRQRGVLLEGYIIRPISGRYSSGFGYRWGSMHTGIDYSAPIGTAVHAADSGVVISVSRDGGYGKAIIIDHGGYQTRYAHLSTYNVSVGQRVHRGDLIAGSGNTGRSTGPHLHFEVIVGGQKVNPAKYY